MIKLKITVTKEILKRSKNCQFGVSIGTQCAISLAIRDIFPDAYVGNADIALFKEDWWFDGKKIITKNEILLPFRAQEFIAYFDLAQPADRLEMDPVSFEIKIPDSAIEKINIEELRPLLTNHPTLELIKGGGK